jgi:hypothetical protein
MCKRRLIVHNILTYGESNTFSDITYITVEVFSAECKQEGIARRGNIEDDKIK